MTIHREQPAARGNDNIISKAFVIAIFIICFLKLVLVGTNEILSIPNDSVNYLRQSQEAIRELGAPPGYSFWLALSTSTGLPQRVAIEMLYLFSSATVAFTLARVIGRPFALLLLGMLAFLPVTFFLFDNALGDGFYGCLTLIALALSIEAMLDHDTSKYNFWLRLLVLAFVLGWMLITRNEDYLVIGWIIWFVACRFVYQRQILPLQQLVREVALSAALLLLGSFSIGGSVSTYHYVTKGVFVRTISTIPSHMDLLRNLASIDDGAPINRVPITKAQRDAAYQASPTLKQLRDYIENPENMYQMASLQAGFPTGEIGAGWVWHVFNDAAIQKLPQKSLKNLNEYYLTINRELTSAFERGAIRKKFVIHPLLAGNTAGLLTNFPKSAARAFNELFESTSYQPDNGFESSLFDSACLRRASLIDLHAYSGKIQGWAFVDHSGVSIEKVEIGIYEAAKGITGAHWFGTEQIARPDVSKAFSTEGHDQPKVFGFRAMLSQTQGDTPVIRYRLTDGSDIVTPPLVSNKVTRINYDSTGRFLTQGIDTTGSEWAASHNNNKHKLQEWLTSSYGKALPYILTIILVAAAISVFLRKTTIRHDQLGNMYLAVSILIAGILMQRILFYILVDAVGWNVEVRYLTSAVILLIVGAVVLVAYSFRAIKDYFAGLLQRN